jgi:4-methyl-5(b-hydroxyethyl)-thiazole monophosphate biosynthesis
MNKYQKAAIFLAEGFEETEAIGTADVLLRSGIEIFFVGVNLARVNEKYSLRGAHFIRVSLDLDLDTSSGFDFDACILPGGLPGVEHLDANQRLKDTIIRHNEDGKLIAAICAAPMVLGNMGLLKGKNATCYPGYEKYLDGAIISDKPVVVDGNLITAKSVAHTLNFGLAIVEYLRGKERADSVREAMYLD